MNSVSISKLRARLASYLRGVRRGGEVQILDGGVPTARPTGLQVHGASDEEDRQRLIRAGIARAGRGRTSAILDSPPPALPTEVRDALEATRADRL